MQFRPTLRPFFPKFFLLSTFVSLFTIMERVTNLAALLALFRVVPEAELHEGVARGAQQVGRVVAQGVAVRCGEAATLIHK